MKRAEEREIMFLMDEALECLKEYHEYGESMRKIGRGFHPTGIFGRSIESIIKAMQKAVDDYTDNL
jgi:hypothetical protein